MHEKNKTELIDKSKSTVCGTNMGEILMREHILHLVGEYYHKNMSHKSFVPGKTPVHYAGRIYNEAEIQAAVEASLLEF